MVVDVLTHPDYRFQGMFTTIGAFALADCERRSGLEFTTGYPIREAVIPGHLKVGWRIRFLIGTYVMPLRMGPLLAARLPWLGKVPGLAALNFVCQGALGGGVSRSLCLDNYGKSLSAAILGFELDIPDALGSKLRGPR